MPNALHGLWLLTTCSVNTVSLVSWVTLCTLQTANNVHCTAWALLLLTNRSVTTVILVSGVTLCTLQTANDVQCTACGWYLHKAGLCAYCLLV